MSGKHLKTKAARRSPKKRSRIVWIIIAVIAVVIVGVIAGLAIYGWNLPDETPETSGAESSEASSAETSTEVSTQASLEAVRDVSIELGSGLQIKNVGSYAGIFMEDGTDEIVSGVLMLVVTNNSEDDIQYAEITIPVSDGEANFSLSTLPAGETVVLLEKNRMAYSAAEAYTGAAMKNVALFSEPVSLCEDQLELQILNGAINVTNISGEDIAGDIVVYYKNSADDIYYGGITYRVRIEGGLKAGEVRQIMASHFSGSGSTIMFATVG